MTPIDVLQTWTGRVLVEGGFAGVHEVMDALYPGIMTLGCGAMIDAAKSELERQHPVLATLTEQLGPITGDNWREWTGRALALLPDHMDIGQHHVTSAFISAQFDKFAQKGGGT